MNTQNALLDRFYLLVEEYLQKKTYVRCREICQSFEEGLRGDKLVKTLEIV